MMRRRRRRRRWRLNDGRVHVLNKCMSLPPSSSCLTCTPGCRDSATCSCPAPDGRTEWQ